jgi:hypothetical protein
MIPKNNGKLKICTYFIILNAATKKDPYPLPFIDEILNTVTRHITTAVMPIYTASYMMASYGHAHHAF